MNKSCFLEYFVLKYVLRGGAMDYYFDEVNDLYIINLENNGLVNEILLKKTILKISKEILGKGLNSVTFSINFDENYTHALVDFNNRALLKKEINDIINTKKRFK